MELYKRHFLNLHRHAKYLFFLSTPVPPDIIDEESSSDTLATEGMRVALTCRAKGNPSPTIAWRREDGKHIRDQFYKEIYKYF